MTSGGLPVVMDIARTYAAPIGAGLVLFTVLEFAAPRTQHPLVTRLRGLLFHVLYVSLAASMLIGFSLIWMSLDYRAPFQVDVRSLSGSNLGVIGGAVVSWWLLTQVVEFFYYWFHRLQHRLPVLWRFHAVHHAIEDLNALNSNHHPSEEFLRIPFVILPISLLFNFAQGYVPWVIALLLGSHLVYIHSSTRLNFGWARLLLPDNRFHRIHHSRSPEHLNKNFGAGSGLWDLVFGTAWLPKRDEWPEVGLDGWKEPTTVRDYFVLPFRRNRGTSTDVVRTNTGGDSPVVVYALRGLIFGLLVMAGVALVVVPAAVK